MRSVYDNILFVTSLLAQKITGSSAVKGAAVDTKGYNSAVLRARAEIATGAPDTASMAVKLQESNTTTDGDFTDALDNSGNVIGFTLSGLASAAAEGLARIEGLGLNRKRYLRIVATPTFVNGTSPGAITFGEINQGRAYTLPPNTAVSPT